MVVHRRDFFRLATVSGAIGLSGCVEQNRGLTENERQNEEYNEGNISSELTDKKPTDEEPVDKEPTDREPTNEESTDGKPVLRDISLETIDMNNGTELQLTVLAESDITVNWLHISLEGPNGNIRGGGQGWEFREVKDGVWETEWTYIVSDEAASGEYYFSRIRVENEADLVSELWPDEPSATIQTDAVPEKPVLTDVSLDAVEVSDDTKLQLTVIAESNVPVNWLHISFEGPNGNIRGGGQGWEFTKVKEGVWKTEWTYTVSDEAASGEYYFSRIHVENEGNLESDPWSEDVGVTIETDADPEVPILKDVSLETANVSEGTELQLTVLAESNVTVNWLHISLEGPNGNIRGGGQGWEFREVKDRYFPNVAS
ncbi:hypothetical protein [Natronorubrum thiooxidans]|uniref:Uncharacterized protein n=1 Tax=Natronorubrum thiooxidans TaxID=308853 RepID=A0A1N7GUH7_9EURY|nr:hypothetical protein [Natronorubrum thiooxidans]SIS16257.1 hypothetical protein SAMN05421752_115116 [Natronorubrum thiooxidans]